MKIPLYHYNFLPVELLLDSFDLREFCLEFIDLVVVLSAAQLQLVPEVVILHLQPENKVLEKSSH